MSVQCISITKIVIALFYWQCVMPITYLPLLILERTEGEVMVEFTKVAGTKIGREQNEYSGFNTYRMEEQYFYLTT